MQSNGQPVDQDTNAIETTFKIVQNDDHIHLDCGRSFPHNRVIYARLKRCVDQTSSPDIRTTYKFLNIDDGKCRKYWDVRFQKKIPYAHAVSLARNLSSLAEALKIETERTKQNSAA